MSNELAEQTQARAETLAPNELPPASGAGEPVDLDWVMRELREGVDRLPAEAIRAARRAKQEMIPRLIAELEGATRDLLEGKSPAGNGHFFAFFLLCEFRARAALPSILRAVSVPGRGAFELLGEEIHANLPRSILTLAEDPLAVLGSLVENRDLNEFLRWGGAEGYRFLVRDGVLTRAQAVERLRLHLRKALDTGDDGIIGPIACELYAYKPREAKQEIREAFAQNRVEMGLISESEFEDVFNSAEDVADPPTVDFHGLGTTHIDDTIDELCDSYCFNQPASLPPMSAPQPVLPRPHAPAFTLPRLPAEAAAPKLAARPRVGRNEPCPCGSGKKFKKCCGGRY